MTERVGFRDQYAGVYARPRPASRPDPLAEVKASLGEALALLEGPRAAVPPVLGRKRANRLGHAVEAARRELRRALQAAGAGPDPGRLGGASPDF